MIKRIRLTTIFPYTTLFRSGLKPSKDLEKCPTDVGHCTRVDGGIRPASLEAGSSSEPTHEARATNIRPMTLPLMAPPRSEEHTSELQSPVHLVCRLLLEYKK